MLSHVRPVSMTTAEHGDTFAVTISGPLTAGGGDLLLRAEVAEALYNGWRKIVLDFTGLSSLDSSGLGELMRASTAVAESDGWMAWVGCPKTMLDVLTITGVDFENVSILDSLEIALEVLRHQP